MIYARTIESAYDHSVSWRDARDACRVVARWER
jgi:hypothetical protein